MSWSVATLTEAPKKASLATPSPPAVTKAPVVGLVDSVTCLQKEPQQVLQLGQSQRSEAVETNLCRA